MKIYTEAQILLGQIDHTENCRRENSRLSLQPRLLWTRRSPRSSVSLSRPSPKGTKGLVRQKMPTPVMMFTGCIFSFFPPFFLENIFLKPTSSSAGRFTACPSASSSAGFSSSPSAAAPQYNFRFNYWTTTHNILLTHEAVMTYTFRLPCPLCQFLHEMHR